MRVTLVNPPLTLEQRYGKLASVGGNLAPLALCSLAATLRTQGHALSIVDGALGSGSVAGVVDAVMQTRPECVGISAVTANISHAAAIAAEIKRRDGGILTVVGGHHATVLPEKTMAMFGGFDVAVLGEGEQTLAELVRAVEGGGSLATVEGIAYRGGRELRTTPPRPLLADLDTLAMPAWDLLPSLADHYRPALHSVRRLPCACLVTSRGCFSKCVFCDRSVFGRQVRSHGAEYVIEMIERLHRDHGIREVCFMDDNFVLSRRRTERLCDHLRSSSMRLTWSCSARVDIVDLELLKSMRAAGCWQVAYGIESGSPEVLDGLNKGVSLEQIERAVRLTRRAGMRARGFVMVGSPGESRETVRQTLRFLTRIPLDDLHVNFFTPYPGSTVYSEASRLGSFQEDWDKMTGWEPVFVPAGMEREQLVEAQRWMIRGFYLRPRPLVSHLFLFGRMSTIHSAVEALSAFLRFSFKT